VLPEVNLRVIWQLVCLCLVLFIHSATAKPLQIATSLSDSRELSQPIARLLQQAYAEIGLQITVVPLPAGRSLRMANQGLYDGELFRIGGLQSQFPNLLQVPVELRQLRLFAYVRADRTDNWQQWQHRKELVIGHVRGFRLATQQQFAGNRVETTTLQQAQELLLQGKIDLLLEDEWSLPANRELQRLPEVLAQAGLFHYLHIRHQALMPALMQALQRQLPAKKNP